MGIKQRLRKLEAIRTNKKKEYVTLIWLDGKQTAFRNKMYNTFDEVLEDYPSIESDYDINNIIITHA